MQDSLFEWVKKYLIGFYCCDSLHFGESEGRSSY